MKKVSENISDRIKSNNHVAKKASNDINDFLEFISETISADNYRDLASRILKVTASKLNADIATLWRVAEDGGKKKLILSSPYNIEFLPSEQEPTYDIPDKDTPNNNIDGLTAWIAVRERHIRVCDAEQLKDPAKPWYGSHRGKWDGSRPWKQKHFGCLLGYYLKTDGPVLGVIKFERCKSQDFYKHFTNEDFVRAKRWIKLIALILEGMISREEQEYKRRKELRDISSKLLFPASETYYEDIIKLIARTLRADICTLWLIDKYKLRLAAQFGLKKEEITIEKIYSIPEFGNINEENIDGLITWTAYYRKPFFAHDWDNLKNHPSNKECSDKERCNGMSADDFGCLYAVPLLIDGKAIGVLKIGRRKNLGFHPFDEIEKSTFDHIAMIVSVAPSLKAAIRDKDNLVLDYFHILRSPTSNAISALDSLRTELRRKEGIREGRVEARLKMLADNIAVAYTQTLNAFSIAIHTEKPSSPLWKNLSEDIIRSSIETLCRLFSEMKIEECSETIKYELNLTELQLKKTNVIIYNLLDNAVAFSNRNPIRIEVYPDQQHNLLLSIIDNGVGIPEEIWEEIWEDGVTFRNDTITRPESRGQGLAIVKRIVSELGWNYSMKSTVGIGTEITIHIKRNDWREI